MYWARPFFLTSKLKAVSDGDFLCLAPRVSIRILTQPRFSCHERKTAVQTAWMPSWVINRLYSSGRKGVLLRLSLTILTLRHTLINFPGAPAHWVPRTPSPLAGKYPTIRTETISLQQWPPFNLVKMLNLQLMHVRPTSLHIFDGKWWSICTV